MTPGEPETSIVIEMMADPLLLREPFQKRRLQAQLLCRLFQHEEIAIEFACHVADLRHGNKLVSSDGGHPPPASRKTDLLPKI